MTSAMRAQVAANDFTRQWKDVRDDCMAAVDRVGASGWLILGEEVERFEREIADWWGLPYAIGVASGLDAIEIALRCAGVKPGNRILTTPLSAFATTLAIVRAGAVPLWCDVDESGCMDLREAERALAADPRIHGIVPVHLYGHPLDPTGLETLARNHEVVVVEDCAQSAGASRDGRPTGSAGVAAATSFYPTKNLGAMGDGGLVLTADEELARRAREMRNYGQRKRYEHVTLGLNSRLDELHAAILRSAHLPRLDGWLQRRRSIAERYDEALADTALRRIHPSGGSSAHHLYAVEVMSGSPGAVAEGLAERGVSVGRHYPIIAPEQPSARGLGETIGDLPTARRIAEREISLPIHPYLTDREVEHVVAACQAACP